MTKTLTEKWREGTLESGHYYIQWSFDCDPRPRNMIDFFDKEYSDGGEFMLQQHKYIDEVLAPVPSYEEWKDISESEDKAHAHLQDEREKNMCLEESVRILEKQLAIATKALKEIHDCTDWSDNAFIYATEALKEIKEVK